MTFFVKLSVTLALLVAVFIVRKKIGDDEFVEAVRGVGYRLIE